MPLLYLLLPALAAASLFKSSKPKPPPTFLSKVLPLVFALTVISIIAVVLYLVYKTMLSVSSDVQSRLDNGGVKLSKNGADVELKGVSYEKYRDLTQQVVVSAWNNSETKGFHSRLWGPKPAKKQHKQAVPQSI